jgi:hypothetical protein
MANTFKFGNGNWAVKDGSALAYNDENNNFKPLPFDFTRASSATTLNRQGLIETVGSGKPRIDFTDNTSGHLLLEPSRTNLVTYSEDFSQWGLGTRITITSSDIVSPDGSQNADKFVETTNNSNHWAENSFSATSGTSYTISMFAKADERTEAVIYAFGDNGVFNYTSAIYDLENGLVISGSGASIENYGNGWYRCIRTMTSGATATGYYAIGISNNQTIQYVGDTSKGLHIWGAQLEAGSYATSYIPTEGSSVTRVVDDIQLVLPDVDSFNSSNGFSVISKFDIGAPNVSSSVPFLFFNDDSSNTYIGFGSNATNLRCRLNLSGAAYLNTQGNAPRTQRNSLFISCDSSGWSQGANGSTNHTGTNNASVFDRLASITFSTSETYGIIKISELLVYNTRLSNTELQNLTS